MTLKKYIWTMFLATILCWSSLVLVVFFVDPGEARVFGFLIFYLACFFAVVGTASILGFLFRHFFRKFVPSYIQVKNSFRQALLFGILIVIVLFLQSKSLIAWWNLILLILIMAMFETFLVSLKKNKKQVLKEE
jgi:uncharacterized membrane protein